MKLTALSLAAVFFTFTSHAADKTGPAETVQTFYAYHFKHDMGFGIPEVKSRKAWLEPKLFDLMIKVLNKPVPKGDAPEIEGDVFTDSQETPTSFRVGKATVENDSAKVDVTFVWSAEKRHATVLLKQAGSAWRISDIVYSDHRFLTKDLQQAAR